MIEDLKGAAKEGVLIAVKWGLLVALIVYAFNFSMNTYTMANNGQTAAIVIRELQTKGWLPKLAPDGTAPEFSNKASNG